MLFEWVLFLILLCLAILVRKCYKLKEQREALLLVEYELIMIKEEYERQYGKVTESLPQWHTHIDKFYMRKDLLDGKG